MHLHIQIHHVKMYWFAWYEHLSSEQCFCLQAVNALSVIDSPDKIKLNENDPRYQNIF